MLSSPSQERKISMPLILKRFWELSLPPLKMQTSIDSQNQLRERKLNNLSLKDPRKSGHHLPQLPVLPQLPNKSPNKPPKRRNNQRRKKLPHQRMMMMISWLEVSLTDLHTKLFKSIQDNLQIQWLAMFYLINKIQAYNKQKIMKINFDQIFDNRQPPPIKFIPKQSQVSTQAHESLFATMKKPKKESITHESSPAKIRNILTTNKDDTTNYKYYKPSKLNDELSANKKQSKHPSSSKKQIRQKIEKVTERLNQPIQCNKKICKKTCNKFELQQFYATLRQQKFYTRPRIEPKHTRSLTETCEIFKKPSKLHERLYWQHKERQFRNVELENQYEQKKIKQNEINLEGTNQEYLKNYVSFYERLDHQVSRRMKKQEYLTHNPNFSVTGKNQNSVFQPNITASMRSINMICHAPRIIPKMQKNTIKGKAQMNKIFNENLNRSLESSVSLTRNQEIMRNKQEKIISRICNLFNNDGYIEVNPESVEELSEAQFEIFFPLLQTLEEDERISVQDFEEMARQYYKQLTVTEKNTIRKIKKNNPQKQKPSVAQKSRKIISKNSQKPLKMPKGTEYLQKLSNFI